MKKIMAFAAVAALVVVGLRRQHSRASASMALTPIEKQSLHDAPNDDGGAPDTALSGDNAAAGGLLGRIAALKSSAASALQQALPGKSDDSAGSGKSVIDLSDEWKDGSRNQGFIGSCHIYATVGLTEAAMFRASGQKLHINESDLFLNSKVISPTKSNNPDKSNDIFNSYCNGASCSLDEGGDFPSDIDYLFNHGATLVTNENPDLRDAFGDSWGNYSSAVTQTLVADNARINAAIVKNKTPDDQYTAFQARSQFADNQRKGPQIDAMNSIIAEQAGNGQDPAAMRVDLRKKMAGLRFYVKALTPVMDALGVPGAPRGACAHSQQGQDTMAVIEQELKARQPVGIGMNLQGIASWGQQNDNEPALHAIIIDGMQRKMLGKVVFTTRNSWGHDEVTKGGNRPNNPEITEDQVCRIDHLYLVLAPSEAAPTAPGFNLLETAAPPSPSARAEPPAPSVSQAPPASPHS
jgi:hypothetical protein